MTDATALGRAISAGEVSARAAMAASFDAIAARSDLSAVVRSLPPTKAEAMDAEAGDGHFDFAARGVDAHLARKEAMAPNATIADVCGLPAPALPAGLAGGMPVGAQIMGPIGADTMLLDIAACIAADVPGISYPAPIAGLRE